MNKRYYLKKTQYFLMRHCVPLSLRQMRDFRHSPKVFANSVPKAGTNLLKRTLNLLPCIAPHWTYHLDQRIGDWNKQLRSVRKGQTILAHFPWSQATVDILRTDGFKMLFMIRDLRDIASSNAFYITYKDPMHRLHSYFRSLSSDEERITASIAGIDADLLNDGIRSKSIGEHADSYLGWMRESRCLTIRFEDLIGARGGGDDEKQFQTVSSIIRHLGVDLSDEEIREIAENTFSAKSRTFRKGVIGDWKNHFTEEHKRLFKETAGEALIKMGYEKGYDW